MSGTKVTKDPEGLNNPIHESSGLVTSDSLAAESLRSGGDFADGHAGISGQKSTGSTASNTDTTNATKLDPASDAEARQAEEGWNETSQLNAGKGLGKEAGVGPTYNTTSSGGSGGNSSSSSAGTAPSAMTQHIDPATQKPKGRNIEEGGFDSNAPNASFKYDIGDKNDPGLAAEQKFEHANARVAGAAGTARDTGPSVGGEYEALNPNEEA